MTVETPQFKYEQEPSPEFNNISEFVKWIQDVTFQFGVRSIYVDDQRVDYTDDPARIKKHAKTLREMGLIAGTLNFQESSEFADILKENGLELGIIDTLTLEDKNAAYIYKEEMASFDGRTAWIHLTDDAGGVYEVQFDSYINGGCYHEGKLLNRDGGWSDYANYFSKGGISYITDQGTDLEIKSVEPLAPRSKEKGLKKIEEEKCALKHALQLANGLRDALDIKLNTIIPNFETIDMRDLPSSTNRSDALR